MSSLKAKIRDDSKYKKFKKIVILIRDQLHVDKDREEALSMHAGRTSRSLYGNKKYSPRSLIDASMNDASCRSRLVEIRVKCSNQIDLLKDAVKAIKKHIKAEYEEDMKAYKTINQKDTFVDNLISAALEIESEGSALISMLDTIITDIDKTSYHLTNMKDALQLLDQSKGGKVI